MEKNIGVIAKISIINGRDLNDKTIGSYQVKHLKSGDINSKGLINECFDKSNDFSILKEDEPIILYLPGHLAYIWGMNII